MADEDTADVDTDAAADEVVDEQVDTEDTTSADADTAEDGDGWAPPSQDEWTTLQQQVAELRDKLKKSNSDAGRHRAKVKELERASEDAETKARREADEAAQAKYKPVAAKVALLEANARTDRVGALLKLLDMDSIEFSGGDVVGLDTEVERVAAEYPEFFAQSEPDKTAPKPAVAPKVAAGPKKPTPEPKTPGEILAAQLLGPSK